MNYQVGRMKYVRIDFARLCYKLLNMIKIQNDGPRNSEACAVVICLKVHKFELALFYIR